MKKQRDLILNSDWDNLVVLDACRIDYFKKIYSDYLSGRLEKVISAGSSTPDWLEKTWKEQFNDIVYVSGNPFINSKGVKVGKFNASEHFGVIIDAWNRGWDDEMKTVPPGHVSRASRIAKVKYPDKRLVSHFMQPHHPYLSLEPVEGGISHLMLMHRNRGRRKGLIEKIRKFTGEAAVRLLGWTRAYRLGRSAGLMSPRPVEIVAQLYGRENLRQAYELNLRVVLEEVAKLTARLPGKSVITAYHGDFLGEDGLYGHYKEVHHPILREVPWLEIRM
jgi:hypothetical protein